MSRTILALAIALFLGTTMLAHAQERMRTTAEIQAEINILKGELLRARIVEEERRSATLEVPAHENKETALGNVKTLLAALPDVLVIGLVDPGTNGAETNSIGLLYREADKEGVELVIDLMLAGFRVHAACIERRAAGENHILAQKRFDQKANMGAKIASSGKACAADVRRTSDADDADCTALHASSTCTSRVFRRIRKITPVTTIICAAIAARWDSTNGTTHPPTVEYAHYAERKPVCST